MTIEQFKHWYWFSIRMAHRGWPGTRKPNARRLARLVHAFFDMNIEPDLLPRLEGWCDTDNSSLPEDRFGHELIGPFLCDLMTTYLGDGTNPYYWRSGGEDHDDAPGARNYERWDESWGDRVRCCVRAGMKAGGGVEMAGVLGFSIGDLRRMYGGRLPQWLTDQEWVVGPLDSSSGEVCDVSKVPDGEKILL